jgi:hypothetical protein
MVANAIFTSNFFLGRATRFMPPKTVVAQCGPEHPSKHLFAPCLHRHANGQLLIVCRWDRHGADEGDATNEQALYFSRNSGATWTLTGDGAILTHADGSSFPTPSSITHAWLFEDRADRTWLFYTLNQPFTWGEGRPDRSTGGGEIRRQEIFWDGATWRKRGASVIVSGFHRPLPDGRGGVAHDIRTVTWNGLVRLRDGSLVMPIGGRSSVTDPQGAFSRLDRVWALVSRDDGATWPEAHFVGGGDSLCVAEPTLVETSRDGELVCLLRVQYGTGNQLHRCVSRDGGRTWSAPEPTGLPQANTQGVKPHLIRLRSGRYALIQTNEQDVIERTNLAIFLTDESGLLDDHWPVIRTLHIGNRRGWWPGSCYGWLADGAQGDVLAAWPCHDATGGRLWFARLSSEYLESAEAVEANGVVDEWGDHVPRLDGPLTPAGERSFSFLNVRGRLVAPAFGVLPHRAAREITWTILIAQAPTTTGFAVLRLTARNGRDEVFVLLRDRAGWTLRDERGQRAVDFPLVENKWLGLHCALAAKTATVSLIAEGLSHSYETAFTPAPTGLTFGGAITPEPCQISVGEITYRGLSTLTA